MEQLKKAESHSLKRKIDNISSIPDSDVLENQLLRNSRKIENLDSTEERITLSFNAFQKHLNAQKTPHQAQTNIQNSSVIPYAQGQLQEKEGIIPVSGPIESPFAIPTAKKLDPSVLGNGEANQSVTLEENNQPFYGTRFEYHQLNNTSFHTASMVKFPMELGGTAFQSRKIVKGKKLSKTPEPKDPQPEQSEPVLTKTVSEKPPQIDDALLKRFMRMFEE